MATWTRATVIGLDPVRRQRAMQVESSSQKAPQATFDFSDLKPQTNAQFKQKRDSNKIQTKWRNFNWRRSS